MTQTPDHMTAEHVRITLEAAFGHIAETGMKDMPIVNPALSVSAFGFEQLGDYHIGTMLTPWFLNLLMIPAKHATNALEDRKIGDSIKLSLPQGQFDFIVSWLDETGRYLSCSMFSPVFEFADQQTAEATAEAILEMVLSEGDIETPEAEAAKEQHADGELAQDGEPEQDDWDFAEETEAFDRLWRGEVPDEVQAEPAAAGAESDAEELASPEKTPESIAKEIQKAARKPISRRNFLGRGNSSTARTEELHP